MKKETPCHQNLFRTIGLLLVLDCLLLVAYIAARQYEIIEYSGIMHTAIIGSVWLLCAGMWGLIASACLWYLEMQELGAKMKQGKLSKYMQKDLEKYTVMQGIKQSADALWDSGLFTTKRLKYLRRQKVLHALKIWLYTTGWTLRIPLPEWVWKRWYPSLGINIQRLFAHDALSTARRTLLLLILSGVICIGILVQVSL